MGNGYWRVIYKAMKLVEFLIEIESFAVCFKATGGLDALETLSLTCENGNIKHLAT
jgi:hypothetical protein